MADNVPLLDFKDQIFHGILNGARDSPCLANADAELTVRPNRRAKHMAALATLFIERLLAPLESSMMRPGLRTRKGCTRHLGWVAQSEFAVVPVTF